MITRLGLGGYGVQRTGSFAGKGVGASRPDWIGTQFSLMAGMTRPYGGFAGKETEGVPAGAPAIAPIFGGTSGIEDRLLRQVRYEKKRSEKHVREDEEILYILMEAMISGVLH